MVGSLLRIGLAAGAMAVVAGTLAWFLRHTHILLLSSLSIVAGAAVYVGASLALGAPEPHAVLRMIRSRRPVPKS